MAVGSCRARQDPFHGGDAAFHGVIAFDHVSGGNREAQLRHGLEESIAACHGGAQAQRAADEDNVPMAKSGQVLHSLANSLAIVDLEDADVGQVGPGIHKHQRELALDELLNQFFLDAEGHHRHAVHIALQHAADQRLGPGRFVVGGADQHFISLRHGQVLKLLHKLGEETDW